MFDLNKIELDARELEHPKPLELAMKALRELDEKSYFYMIHRKNPIPLLDLASEQHYQILNKEDSQGNWHILICKNPNIDLSELVNNDV
ncbi:DUF2249 domain-containing protein [Sulfurovum sp.]|uniref:DUF2249 domain-containing protein n=1 Tax=Sulfurovum sp. TaxID=1969726 RepID=UPI0025F3AB80|nr:DUF2249 domain-containing protein [Sulfurovum sp.]